MVPDDYVPGSDPDEGDVGPQEGQGGSKKPPRWQRHKNQRDEAYRMMNEQGRRIDQLTSLVEKLVDGGQPPSSQPAPQNEGSTDAWREFTDQQLNEIRNNPTYIQEKPDLVAAAGAELLERRMNRKLTDTRRDLESRQNLLQEQDRRVNQVEGYLIQKYGDAITDVSSEFRQLYEAQLESYRLKDDNKNTDREKPELKIAAASLVADKLGWAPRGGSESEQSSGSPPAPSPADIPESGSDAAPGGPAQPAGLPDPAKEGTRKYSQGVVSQLFPDKVGGGR